MSKHTGRILTDADMVPYERLVNFFLYKHIGKSWMNFNHGGKSEELAVGNTGKSRLDFKQELYLQVVLALLSYDPDHVNAQGMKTAESSWVFKFLKDFSNGTLRKYTSEKHGYKAIFSEQEEDLNNAVNSL